jgi:hypothetical protein
MIFANIPKLFGMTFGKHHGRSEIGEMGMQ